MNRIGFAGRSSFRVDRSHGEESLEPRLTGGAGAGGHAGRGPEVTFDGDTADTYVDPVRDG